LPSRGCRPAPRPRSGPVQSSGQHLGDMSRLRMARTAGRIGFVRGITHLAIGFVRGIAHLTIGFVWHGRPLALASFGGVAHLPIGLLGKKTPQRPDSSTDVIRPLERVTRGLRTPQSRGRPPQPDAPARGSQRNPRWRIGLVSTVCQPSVIRPLTSSMETHRLFPAESLFVGIHPLGARWSLA
jgi:hypothetical protein